MDVKVNCEQQILMLTMSTWRQITGNTSYHFLEEFKKGNLERLHKHQHVHPPHAPQLFFFNTKSKLSNQVQCYSVALET
jgi:hypothetical protein